MLFAALTLLLAAQDAPAAMPQRGPGKVVMLGERAQESAVPELRAGAGERVTLSIGTAPTAAGQRDFVLVPGAFRAADDTAIARAARSAERVTFGAGSLREWYLQLFPNRHKSELVHALLEARRFGATIAGRGDSAALLAGATVAADERELGEVEHNPRKLGLPRCVWGMAYEPRLIVDLESRSGGTLARLVEVMLAEKLQLGAWIADDAALVGDLQSESLTCRGGRVVVLDLRGARHVQHMLLGAHLSILLDGDAWLERPRAPGEPGATRATSEAGAPTERDVPDALDVAALCALLAENAERAPETLVLRDATHQLTLTFDADSALLPRADPRSAACSRARLDLLFAR